MCIRDSILIDAGTGVGDLAIAGRNSQFEILYDLPERVLPPAVLALPTPSPEDADRELFLVAGAAKCLPVEDRRAHVGDRGDPLFEQFAHQGVVACELFELAGTPSIQARVADPGAVSTGIGERQQHQGRAHAFEFGRGLGVLIDRQIGEFEGAEQTARRVRVIGLAMQVDRGLDCDPAGGFAGEVARATVGAVLVPDRDR